MASPSNWAPAPAGRSGPLSRTANRSAERRSWLSHGLAAAGITVLGLGVAAKLYPLLLLGALFLLCLRAGRLRVWLRTAVAAVLAWVAVNAPIAAAADPAASASPCAAAVSRAGAASATAIWLPGLRIVSKIPCGIVISTTIGRTPTQPYVAISGTTAAAASS